MVYTVLSRIMKDSKLAGFLLLAGDGELRPVTLQQIEKAGCNVEYTNAKYDEEFKTLEGVGMSLTSYPSINTNYALVSKGGIVISHTVEEDGTGKQLGVIAYNALGTRYNLTYKRLSELLKGNTACNFSLKSLPNGDIIARPLVGGAFPVTKLIKRTPKRMYHSGLDVNSPVKITEAEGKLPAISVLSFDDVKTNEFSQSAQEKLVLAGANMKILTPYYYTLLQAIHRKPAIGFGTMGVTEDTLYYDLQFVASLTVAQLSFVLVHEILHMAMQHSLRFQGRKSQYLWNIATDLYINSVICNDFGVSFGDEEKEIAIGKDGELAGTAVLQTPAFGVYLDTIGETLDLARDTPETIYMKLLKENNQNMPKSSKSQQGQGKGQQGQGQPGQGQGQQVQGQQGQSQQSQQGQQGQSQQEQQGQGQGQQGQGQGQGQQGQQGQGQQDGDSSDPFGSSELGSPATNPEDTYDSSQDSISNDGFTKCEVVYNGKKLKGSIMTDVMTNDNSSSDDTMQKNIDASKAALQRMDTKVKLTEEELGESLTKNAGSGANLCKRHIEFGLASSIDWRVILRNLCNKKPKKTFTLGSPQTDYASVGVILPDRRRIGKPTTISGIKFALDVSGSVSQKELNGYLSAVNSILSRYDIEGELIYWSTNIGDAGNFSDLRDMLKVQPLTTGGTDVRCVFDYLAGVTKVHGKKEATRIRDITAVFIVTDGCFAHNYKDYETMFGRKVYWLITENPIGFNPPFGRVIKLDI